MKLLLRHFWGGLYEKKGYSTESHSTLLGNIRKYRGQFFPSNCRDNKLWHPAVSVDLSRWKTPHGELFSLFLVSSSLIVLSDIKVEVFASYWRAKQKLEKSEEASWHIRVCDSIERGCEFDGGAGGLIDKEDNFGEYGCNDRNQDHRCSSSPASTTQHRFWAKYYLWLLVDSFNSANKISLWETIRARLRTNNSLSTIQVMFHR